jgi:hypothetical protein
VSGVDLERMVDTARQVADFAYRQGVGGAVAVDDLIGELARVRDENRELRDGGEQLDGVIRRLVAENEELRATVERYRAVRP